MQLKLAAVHKQSVVDGPGVRTVVFAQGCPHHCPGCHNPQTHNPNGGKWVGVSEVAAEILQDTFIKNVTFSGGEPFAQAQSFAELAAILKNQNIHLVIYSGYTYEQLLEKSKTDSAVEKLLVAADLLVDGPYREEQKDLALLYRGSANQRIIDVPSSQQCNKIVLSELHFRGRGKNCA